MDSWEYYSLTASIITASYGPLVLIRCTTCHISAAKSNLD